VSATLAGIRAPLVLLTYGRRFLASLKLATGFDVAIEKLPLADHAGRRLFQQLCDDVERTSFGLGTRQGKER
jgi:hypothetical protein